VNKAALKTKHARITALVRELATAIGATSPWSPA